MTMTFTTRQLVQFVDQMAMSIIPNVFYKIYEVYCNFTGKENHCLLQVKSKEHHKINQKRVT